MGYAPNAIESLAMEGYEPEGPSIALATPQEALLSNVARLEPATFTNDAGETYRMRLWTRQDADELAAVYQDVYPNREHCDRSIFEPRTYLRDERRLKRFEDACLAGGRAVPNVDLWFVVEKETAPGTYDEVVGSFLIRVHSDDLSGELARFAVKHAYQGSHIGGKAIAQLDRYAEELGLEKAYADATSPVSLYSLLKNGYAPEGFNVGEFVEQLATGDGHKRLHSTRVAKLTPKGLSRMDTNLSDLQLTMLLAGAEYEEGVRESVGLGGPGMHGAIIKEIAARDPAAVRARMESDPRLAEYLQRALAAEA